MSTTCVFPAVLKLLLTKGGRGPLSVAMDLLALLMQCSSFFLITRFLTRDNTSFTNIVDICQYCAAVVLISLRYWENFVDRNIGVIPIQSLKTNIRLGRCKTYIFASLWKIGLTLAFAYILVPNMTPMNELFAQIRNETLYSNISAPTAVPDQFDYGPNLEPVDAVPPGVPDIDMATPGFLPTTPAAMEMDPASRILPRFRRQAPERINSTTEVSPDYYDATADSAGGDIPTGVSAAGTEVAAGADSPGDSPPSISRGPRGGIRNTPRGRRRGRGRIRRPRPSRPGMFSPRRPSDGFSNYNFEYDTESEEPSQPFTSKKIDVAVYRFLPLIIQCISGAVCYYFARVACKLCMQGFGFSFPLALISPATAAVFCYLCYLEDWTRVRLSDFNIGYWKCTESFEDTSFHWQIGCALGLWWLSQLWINNHIWFGKSERLAKVER